MLTGSLETGPTPFFFELRKRIKLARLAGGRAELLKRIERTIRHRKLNYLRK